MRLGVRVSLPLGTKQVADGQVQEPELAGDSHGLSTLPGAWRACDESDQPCAVVPFRKWDEAGGY